MSDNKTRISLADLSDYALTKNVHTTKIKSCGRTFEILEFISATAVNAFVTRVVESSYDENGNYDPVLKDYAINFAILCSYTNIDVSFDEGNALSSIEQLNAVMYGTDLLDRIKESINWTQYSTMCRSIDEIIEYKNNVTAAAVDKQITELSETLKELGSEVNSMFDGVSQDDVNALFSAIGSGGIDENSLVKAIVGLKDGE